MPTEMDNIDTSNFQKALDRIGHTPPANGEEPFFYLNHPESELDSTVIRVEPRYLDSHGTHRYPKKVKIAEIPVLDEVTYSRKSGDTKFEKCAQNATKPLSSFVGECKQVSAALSRDLSVCRTLGEESTNADLIDQYAKGYRAIERAQLEFPIWVNDQAKQIVGSMISEIEENYKTIQSTINASTAFDETTRSKLSEAFASAYKSEQFRILHDQCVEFDNYHNEIVPSRKLQAEQKRWNASIRDTIESKMQRLGMTDEKPSSTAAWLQHQNLKVAVKSCAGMNTKTPTSVESWQALCKSSEAASTVSSTQVLTTTDRVLPQSASNLSNSARSGYPEPGHSE